MKVTLLKDGGQRDFILEDLRTLPCVVALFFYASMSQMAQQTIGESFSRRLGFIAEGSYFNKEVAAFLKNIGGDSS